MTLQLARLFASYPEFARVRFLVADEAGAALLAGLGIGQSRIIKVPGFPLLRRYERFHGFLSEFRYRRLRKAASAYILPEPRTALWSRTPQAVMFHDFLSNRERRPFLARKWDRELYFRYKNWKAAKVADRIFTNSSHTRAEAMRLYPFLNPGAVSAIHLGARFRGDPGRPGTAVDAALFRFPSRLPLSLPLRFLYVGSFETRKNIPALLENLDRVAGGRPFRFDLVGRIPDAERARLQALGSVHVHGDVRFHGRIGDAELGKLYGEAQFLLFPSLGEGFGLPIVEAMSFGLVVLAFANTCMPEVAEDAAMLAADGDFAAWGAALTELVSEPARYAAMSEKARARASHFTEEKMFQRYAAFFRDWFRAHGLALEPGGAP